MSTTQLPPLDVARKELDSLLDHIYEHGTTAEGVSDRALLLCKAYALAALSSVEGEPDRWEGAEGWEPLAWALCAEEHGEEACNQLIWEGGPVPEPWGDRWMEYEGEAKRLIALVHEHVRPQPAQAFDVEAMLHACVPGGSVCDPQRVADAIRDWFKAQPAQANFEPDQRTLESLGYKVHEGGAITPDFGQADAAQGGRVPDGWKLVPAQATKEMIEAGISQLRTYYRYHEGYSPAECWRHMLAASPEPAAASQEAVETVPREWRNALRKLAFMARTSGGTPGPDSGLMQACSEAEALLSQPYLHATPPASHEQAQQPGVFEVAADRAEVAKVLRRVSRAIDVSTDDRTILCHAAALIELDGQAQQPAQAEAGTVGDERAKAINALMTAASLLAPCVEDGNPISLKEARDVLRHLRETRAALQSAQAVGEDTKRLDYIQRTGSTIDILPAHGPAWGFRVGGDNHAVSTDVRAAIDAALANTKEAGNG